MPTCNVKVISQFNFKNYGAGFITMRRVMHWFRRDLRVTNTGRSLGTSIPTAMRPSISARTTIIKLLRRTLPPAA